MAARYLAAFHGDRRAVTAVEFAMVLPAFLALLVGGIHTSLALFCASSLNYAVQQGARCASLQTSGCVDAAATQTYTRGRYQALGDPAFVYTAAACGNQVSGTLTYKIGAVVAEVSVPISASACFP